MIGVGLADAGRVIEALYVAAGARPGSVQAAEWRALAGRLEAGVDALPPVVEPVCSGRPIRRAVVSGRGSS